MSACGIRIVSDDEDVQDESTETEESTDSDEVTKIVIDGGEVKEGGKNGDDQDEDAEEDDSDEEEEEESKKIKKTQSKTEEELEEEEEEEEPEEEISDVELIELYYSNITDGDLEGAYALKDSPKPYDTFYGWYKTTKSAVPDDFEKLSEHKYRFMVHLHEGGTNEEKYSVTMEVKDGLLDTISSVQTWNNYKSTAYIEKSGDNTEKLYVTKNGEEKLVTTIEADYSATGSHHSINEKFEFLVSDKYLVYRLNGYEWMSYYIYDIDAGKSVHYFNTASKYGFTDDGKYFYQCQGSGMHTGYVKVYNASDFSLHKNLNSPGSGALVYWCYDYNSSQNTYKYSLGFDGFSKESVRFYDFDTGVIN